MDRNKRDISLFKKIEKFCEEIDETHKNFGNTLNNFNENKDYFKSVTMSLLQIGELANHLSKEFKEKYNDIPYSLIVGLRNIVAHGYGSLDQKNVWDISQEYVPLLQARCHEILSEIKPVNQISFQSC